MKQRMILVGDTAGFADPITAEGLTFALKSGLEAGNALVRGVTQEEVSSLYHAAIDEEIVRELALAAKFTRPFYFSSRLRKMLFNQYGERLCRGMANYIEGRRTYRQALGKGAFFSRFFKGTN
jgi:flavin-dependent dehydrogenase